MENNKLKISIFLALLISSFINGNMALASEITGILTANIDSNQVETEINGVVITSPIANPTAGVYTVTQSVSLTASGASSIHYTTDGTTPTCATGTVYSSNISVSSNMVIEAISCYPENNKSSVASYLYAINIPAITNNPGSNSGNRGNISNQNTTIPSLLSLSVQKVYANKDNKIDVLDFVTLMANWGKTGSNNTADFNSDGKIDILDFVLLMANWTK